MMDDIEVVQVARGVNRWQLSKLEVYLWEYLMENLIIPLPNCIFSANLLHLVPIDMPAGFRSRTTVRRVTFD